MGDTWQRPDLDAKVPSSSLAWVADDEARHEFKGQRRDMMEANQKEEDEEDAEEPRRKRLKRESTPRPEDGESTAGLQVGMSVRLLEWEEIAPATSKRRSRVEATGYVDGKLVEFLPTRDDLPARWRVEFSDSDREDLDLEEDEANEATLAHKRGLYEMSYSSLIPKYVAAGVNFVRDGKKDKMFEKIPPEFKNVKDFFEHVDIFVGDYYGRGKFYWHTSVQTSHYTTSCREPMVVVLPKVTTGKHRDRKCIWVTSWKGSVYTKKDGWKIYPAHRTARVMGEAADNLLCPRSVLFAAILWPTWYEFVEPTKEMEKSPNYRKIMKQNQGVATHILGEAVMPRVARAIMDAAASAQGGNIETLVDMFCCGGGFSIGAVEAVGSSLKHVIGIDCDPIVLANFAQNMPIALRRERNQTCDVKALQQKAPTTFAALKVIHQPESGTHLHFSPPCQSFVNSKGGKSDMERVFRNVVKPCLKIMMTAAAKGATCSLEEHKNVAKHVLDWLSDTSQASARKALYVYQSTARDYGSPTNRVRCIITTFALEGERRLEP